MAITTLKNTKVILKIKNSSKDDQINLLIPMIEGQILEHRNKDFDVDSDGNTVYPNGSEIIAIKMIGIQLMGSFEGKKSEKLDDWSIAYNTGDGTGNPTATLLKGIKRYARLI